MPCTAAERTPHWCSALVLWSAGEPSRRFPPLTMTTSDGLGVKRLPLTGNASLSWFPCWQQEALMVPRHSLTPLHQGSYTQASFLPNLALSLKVKVKLAFERSDLNCWPVALFLLMLCQKVYCKALVFLCLLGHSQIHERCHWSLPHHPIIK